MVLGAVLLAAWVSGCGSSRGDHPAPGSAVERLRSRSAGEAAATVDGHPLGDRVFETFWRANRDASAETVVEDVIDREIAVQRALEREYHRDSEFGFVRKKGMVRALLRDEIEEEVRAESLDDQLVARIEQKLRRRLGHPRGIQASHLLVMVPRDKNKTGDKDQGGAGEVADREALAARAREWAGRIRESLPAEPTVEQLFFARREYRDRVPDPLEIVVNAHLSFPAPDARPFDGDLPETWMRVVGPFAEAADGLLADGRTGVLSEPVESKYGWHLVVSEKRLDGKVPDPEVLGEVAVSQALQVERARVFEQKMKQWRQGTSIAGYPEAIAEQADDDSE